MKPDSRDLLRSYRDHGVVTGGGELLLPGEWALDLVNELERLGVDISGVDYWYRIPNGSLAESVGSWELSGTTVADRAESARKAITDVAPPDTLYFLVVFEGYSLPEI